MALNQKFTSLDGFIELRSSQDSSHYVWLVCFIPLDPELCVCVCVCVCVTLTSCKDQNQLTYRMSLILDSEKAMTPHSSTLALKIHRWRSLVGCSPWGCEESDTTSLPLFTFMHRRRKWQPTPLFLPGESQGRRSLVGCRQWGRTESDTTEAT